MGTAGYGAGLCASGCVCRVVVCVRACGGHGDGEEWASVESSPARDHGRHFLSLPATRCTVPPLQCLVGSARTFIPISRCEKLLLGFGSLAIANTACFSPLLFSVKSIDGGQGRKHKQTGRLVSRYRKQRRFIFDTRVLRSENFEKRTISIRTLDRFVYQL